MQRYFSSLVEELSERSTSALLGALAPVSDPLRKELRRQLGALPGAGEGFLADPVFEPIFEWVGCGETMAELRDRGLLSAALVKAMATRSTTPELKEYAFPVDREPYLHQRAAFEQLTASDVRSALVTSGTGSGKTECFLVPILDDLAREQQHDGKLTGVRALFLYPLNALINSQRDRLRAWCEPFNGNIRFALYKGDLPDKAPASVHRADRPATVSDRTVLRAEAPPILVTNSTMLEYMLVRREDQPIVQQSQGKLRWIVLDEAHTYLGSAAAETALLLRRVLHSFGVTPDEVRFVATSATIGDGSDKSREDLRNFLADLAGVDPSHVAVIEGKRRIPVLPDRFSNLDYALPAVEELAQMTPAEKFDALGGNVGVRRMRQELLDKGARKLGDLAELIGPGTNRQHALRLLDACSEAEQDSEALLRLRSHLFQKTHAGTWACLNPACPDRRDTPLDDPAWPFGKLFMSRRDHCDRCAAMVYEIVLCDQCGAEYLTADLELERGSIRYAPHVVQQQDDDENFELVDENEDEEPLQEVATVARLPRLLTSALANSVTPVQIRVSDGSANDDEGLAFGEIAPNGTDGAFHCARCRHNRGGITAGEPFRSMARGASFFLRSTIPTLLEHTTPFGGSRQLPSDGRRLLTFTDSRQGTARFALDAQLDSERNYIRSFVYHQLAAQRVTAGVAAGDIEKLEAAVASLQIVVGSGHHALQGMLAKAKADLAAAMAPPNGTLQWSEMAAKLMSQTEIQAWMPNHWKHLALSDLKPRELADFVLLREFARRPKRQNSLETLGLAALDYPDLRTHAAPPPAWLQRSRTASEWNHFLKLCVDYFVRAYSAVDIDREMLRWLGVAIRPKVLVGPDAEPTSRNVVRWPTVARGAERSRLVQLLAQALGVFPEKGNGAEDIDECLRAAWDQVARILSQGQEGAALRLQEKAVLRELPTAWLCPVTRRVLDTTLIGMTPYVMPKMSAAEARCKEIELPSVPYAFWRELGGKVHSVSERWAWLRNQATVAALIDAGVWSDLSSRVVAFSPFFRVAEHSAQLDAGRLRDLEGLFREGNLNVLSCSTTMEMGVDIGGLSAVAMNNTPPSAANYLQRSGRAGRRKESRAFSMTLCRATPHGEYVFHNPTWPFDTKSNVTRVTLNSERIIQRHVNALALNRYFSTQLSEHDLRRLTAAAFFESTAEASSSVCERFESWLISDAAADAWVECGLRSLVRRSVAESASMPRLLTVAAEDARRAREGWQNEINPLLAQFDETEQTNNDPAKKAVEMRLKRLREEYLLKELTLRNFLPAHGFPTHVVSFVTTTVEDIKRQRTTEEREDNLQRRHSFPSRDLTLALREYAPGSTVVVDGRVLESNGVTLNWHIPAGDETVNEVQALKYAWRCRHCGRSGVSQTMPGMCTSGECSPTYLDAHKYLEPAGFTVAIGYSPNNDLTKNQFVPIEEPWVTSAGEAWQALPNPQLGRYRYSPRGRLFTHSRGQHGFGYALCLRCGAAASQTQRDKLPHEIELHKPLRGGKDRNAQGLCTGNDQQWAIQQGLWLGVARETDVFELQLRDPKSGHVVHDLRAAASLAVALRQALAQSIGIEEREIGWAIAPSRTELGEQASSIYLYDAPGGGAGFVAQATFMLSNILLRARGILLCTRDCDRACHACLLTADTQYAAESLDRRSALKVLGEEFINSLALPDEMRFFGPASTLEFEPLLSAIRRELGKATADRVRVVLAGPGGEWDIDTWPIEAWLIRWKADAITAQIALPKSLLAELSANQRNRLASWSEAGLAKVVTLPDAAFKVGNGYIAAEVQRDGNVARFAVRDASALIPHADWGKGVSDALVVRAVNDSGMPVGEVCSGTSLRVLPPGTATQIEVGTQLNGPVSNFGLRFWGLVGTASPEALSLLRGNSAIERVSYRDRYIATPAQMRFVVEVFRGLNTIAEKPLQSASLEVVTARPDSNSGPAMSLNDNWAYDAKRPSLFEEALSGIGAGRKFEERSKRETPHARELEVIWADGNRLLLHLDEGFGFLRADQFSRIKVEGSASKQAAALLAIPFDVVPYRGTRMYVIGSKQGPPNAAS
jgi:DEAD/DEAH box helicase domain-containing protein